MKKSSSVHIFVKLDTLQGNLGAPYTISRILSRKPKLLVGKVVKLMIGKEAKDVPLLLV